MTAHKPLAATLSLVSFALLIQAVRCRKEVRNSRARLAGYGPKQAHLSYGAMTYVDRGDGPVILSSHGMFGGFDQAFNNVSNYLDTNRILAPSRFGYPGSEVGGQGTPREQADAFVELLDKLGIDKAFIMGASAGGTAAIRFALDYPNRTHGLILYSSAMPFPNRPPTYSKRQGPPSFLMNDYLMYLLSPLFGPVMGMSNAIINQMMPISERKAGALLDTTVGNPDMARNFDDYPIEELQVPLIILHAKDDKLADYKAMEKVINRFPDCTFVSFDTGGHMMKGHEDEGGMAVRKFMKRAIRNQSPSLDSHG